MCFFILALEFELKADTVYKQKEGDSRLLIRGTDNSTILDELTVMKSQGNKLSKKYILDVKASVRGLCTFWEANVQFSFHPILLNRSKLLRVDPF